MHVTPGYSSSYSGYCQGVADRSAGPMLHLAAKRCQVPTQSMCSEQFSAAPQQVADAQVAACLPVRGEGGIPKEAGHSRPSS